jgi:hypothetical protein
LAGSGFGKISDVKELSDCKDNPTFGKNMAEAKSFLICHFFAEDVAIFGVSYG